MTQNADKQVDKIICFKDPFNSTAHFMKHNPFLDGRTCQLQLQDQLYLVRLAELKKD